MTLFLRKITVRLFSFLRLMLRRRSTIKSCFLSFSKETSFPVTFRLLPGEQSYINDVFVTNGVSLNRFDVFEYDNVTNRTLYNTWLKYNGTVDFQKTPPSERTYVSRGGAELQDCLGLWDEFIENSRISVPWRHAGFHYACFILDEDRWSAPSWIWTNGAIGRYYARNGRIVELCDLADRFLDLQLDIGGWVVRYDFKGKDGRLSQSVAPNDSAYICANTLLPAYIATGKQKYLAGAQCCAAWIMQFCREDGLVYISYELESQRWDKSCNIVDIGFTADLFVKMADVTGDKGYLEFARKFLRAYLNTFYLGNGRFTAAIDVHGNPRGTGVFSRGHAWALEGLIPYYRATEDPEIKQVIEEIVNYMLRLQLADGSWLHVYRPGIMQLLSGSDCKGTPVLAHALLRWAASNPALTGDITGAVRRAVIWCMRHTATRGAGKGGIFAWSPEGAFAGKTETAAACVYANCYLGEILRNGDDLSGGMVHVECQSYQV